MGGVSFAKRSLFRLFSSLLLRSFLLHLSIYGLISSFHVGTEHRSFRTEWRRYMSVPNAVDTFTSGLASIARLPKGVTVRENLNVDTGSISIEKLYDIENDSNCRKVRERITELDLVVKNVIPFCTNARVWNDDKEDKLVGSIVPRMVVRGARFPDETTLQGAEEILQYLDDTFLNEDGPLLNENGNDSKAALLAVMDPLTSGLAGLLRFGKGKIVCAAALSPDCPRPDKSLVLYSYEGNQFCRLVREVLTELDITYELRSAGKKSERRTELANISGGSSQCPYLLDPNTNVSMKESKDIIEYLYKTYGKWTPPNELLQFISSIITPLAKPIFSKLAAMQVGESYDSEEVKKEIEVEITSAPVVVYTYKLSPFCTETTALLDRLDIGYKEISLGLEWIPGLITFPEKRLGLGEMTGQTSLPHIFVGGKSIGGLFSGTPGLLPCIEAGALQNLVAEASP